MLCYVTISPFSLAILYSFVRSFYFYYVTCVYSLVVRLHSFFTSPNTKFCTFVIVLIITTIIIINIIIIVSRHRSNHSLSKRKIIEISGNRSRISLCFLSRIWQIYSLPIFSLPACSAFLKRFPISVRIFVCVRACVGTSGNYRFLQWCTKGPMALNNACKQLSPTWKRLRSNNVHINTLSRYFTF